MIHLAQITLSESTVGSLVTGVIAIGGGSFWFVVKKLFDIEKKVALLGQKLDDHISRDC